MMKEEFMNMKSCIITQSLILQLKYWNPIV